jgi:hypothetical protein
MVMDDFAVEMNATAFEVKYGKNMQITCVRSGKINKLTAHLENPVTFCFNILSMMKCQSFFPFVLMNVTQQKKPRPASPSSLFAIKFKQVNQ